MARGAKVSTFYGTEILPVISATLKLKILLPECERSIIKSEDFSFMHKKQTRRPQGTMSQRRKRNCWI
jgi:hypothetical protein